MYLWKWYDEGLLGWWNVRNSEGKGGWKYDISESQHFAFLPSIEEVTYSAELMQQNE